MKLSESYISHSVQTAKLNALVHQRIADFSEVAPLSKHIDHAAYLSFLEGLIQTASSEKDQRSVTIGSPILGEGDALSVYLRRNLNHKQYIFAL